MRRSAHYARLALAGSFVLLVVLILHELGAPIPWPAPAEHIYELIDFVAAGCCLWRAAVYRPERAAWLAIGLGVLSFAVADLYYVVAFTNVDEVPFPSIDDAFYLGLYPGCYVGLILLLKRRAPGLSAGVWLDGLIGVLGFASLAAAVLIGAVVEDTGGDTMEVMTNIAYPLADVLLLALLVGVFAVFGWRAGRTWAVVAAAFAVFAIVDVIYLYQVAYDTYDGGLLDVGWPAALLLIAVAAWRRPHPLERRDADGVRLLVVPATAGLGALAILSADHYMRTNAPALWLASSALLAVVLRFGLTFRDHVLMLRRVRFEATTDALTGLGNRRVLVSDLERLIAAEDPRPATLMLFDLDGFKHYNDTFGHPAGDLLLQRLGASLNAAISGIGGRAYRMGGDEFCVLLTDRAADDETAARRAAQALSETGDGFAVTASQGRVRLDSESAGVAEALALADQRMYSHKRSGRVSAGRQSRDVLLRAVEERNADLGEHVNDVARLAELTATNIGIGGRELTAIRHGAELHDIGKLAIPDAILNKPGPLDEDEREFMRRHTIIGERIVSAAPALADVAGLVRSSHERYDGAGYPDRLAGADIPIGSRIIAVCDAWDAMTSDRPYRARMTAEAARAELLRCAGAQFDPAVVDAFLAALRQLDASAPRAA